MGLSAGLIPPRVDAGTKAGLLALVDHAVGQGWSARRAGAVLGVDHVRLVRSAARAGQDGAGLDDARPGPARARPRTVC